MKALTLFSLLGLMLAEPSFAQEGFFQRIGAGMDHAVAATGRGLSAAGSAAEGAVAPTVEFSQDKQGKLQLLFCQSGMTYGSEKLAAKAHNLLPGQDQPIPKDCELFHTGLSPKAALACVDQNHGHNPAKASLDKMLSQYNPKGPAARYALRYKEENYKALFQLCSPSVDPFHPNLGQITSQSRGPAVERKLSNSSANTSAEDSAADPASLVDPIVTADPHQDQVLTPEPGPVRVNGTLYPIP